MPDNSKPNPFQKHKADFARFKTDPYSAQYTGKDIHASKKIYNYEDVIRRFNAGQLSRTEVQREIKQVAFSSADEINDAFKNHFLNSGEANDQAKQLIHNSQSSLYNNFDYLNRLDSNDQAKQLIYNSQSSLYNNFDYLNRLDSNEQIVSEEYKPGEYLYNKNKRNNRLISSASGNKISSNKNIRDDSVLVSRATNGRISLARTSRSSRVLATTASKSRISSSRSINGSAILIAAIANGKVDRKIINNVQRKVIANRSVAVQRHVSNKLRSGGFLTAKFTAKTNGKVIGATGSIGVGFTVRKFDSDIRKQNNALNQKNNNVKSMAISGIRRLGSFSGSSILSVQNRINYQKEYYSQKEYYKVNSDGYKRTGGESSYKTQDERSIKQRQKASEIYARKTSHSSAYYASNFRGSYSTTSANSSVSRNTSAHSHNVKNVAKAIAKTGMAAAAATERAASRATTQIMNDNLGKTDPAMSQLGNTAKAGTKLAFNGGKKAAKLTYKTGKKAAEEAHKTAKATSRVAHGVVHATTAAVNVMTNAVAVVANVVTNVIIFVVSNPIIIAILAVIAFFASLLAEFAALCAVSVPLIASSNYTFLAYTDKDTIFEAEKMYSEAETELSAYASGMQLEEAKKWLDPDDEYGLTEDNTFLNHTYDTTYHNPYNFISYMCVKYGYGWDLDNVEYECNYNNSDSMLHQQYRIYVSFGADDAASVREALKSTIEEQIGAPYNTGGRGDTVWSGSYNYCGTWPIFDCSGLTAYTYLNVMGIQLDYNVSDAYGTSGQWEQGDPIEKQSGESSEDFIKRLEVGDLLFMSPNSSAGGRPGHVGMYVGNGEMVDAHYLYTDSAGHYRGIVAKETLYIDRAGEYEYYRDPDSIMGVRRIIGSSLDTYNYSDDNDDQDPEDQDNWIVTVKFVNNGMDAAARTCFDDDENALTAYLTMCYNYGVEEGTAEEDNPFAQEWPYDRYKTHSDSFENLQDFIDAKGISSDFDVDKVYTNGTITGSAVGSLPSSGDYFFVDETTSALWPLPLAVHTSRIANGYTDISSDYGWHDSAHPNGHNGTDFPAPDGTDVYAIYGGSVYETREHNVHYGSSQGGSINECGNYIIVQSEVTIGGKSRALYIRYQHLRECPNLSKNTNVTQGTVVGHVGNTGYSTGNHLHISVWLDAVYGTSVGGMDTLFPNAASHGVTWVAHW